MPSRNVIKINVPESYYHVYARGSNKHLIFADESDYLHFLSLFARYLVKEKPDTQPTDHYQKLYDSIEVLVYCLMQNHFHLLLYQIEESGMTKLMHGVMTSYSRYFNKKYDLSGALFETTYKASMIMLDRYLMHISRYIHINPKYWRTYKYSSLPYYLSRRSPEWLQIKRIIELFSSPDEYEIFIADYEDYKDNLDEIKYELADG